MQKQIEKIRIKIDQIDGQIIDLLENRLSYVDEVAQLKAQNQKISYIKADREYNMMMNLQKYSSKIPKAIIFQIWRNIISFSLFREKKFNIYFTANKKELDHASLLINNYFSYLPEIFYQDITVNNTELLEKLANNVIIGSINDSNFVRMLINHPNLKIFAKLGAFGQKNYYAAALIPEQYLVQENYLILSNVNKVANIATITLSEKQSFINICQHKKSDDICLGTYANIEKIC